MDVKLPSLGEGAESGTVVKLVVSEGDTIAKDQTILELENEKAVAPIPSTAAGKVEKIYVKEGDEVSVGDRIIGLAEEEAGGEEEEKEQGEPSEKKPEKKERPKEDETEEKEASREGARPPQPRQVSPSHEQTPGRAPASPSVRQLARQLGIDLGRVPGTERGGRITIGDLRAYIEWLQKRAFSEGEASGAAREPPLPDFSRWGETRRESLSGVRKTIARRMRQSWSNVPQVTQFGEAEIDGWLDLKAKYKGAYEKQGVSLTLTALLVKAVVAVLKDFPRFNASLDAAAGEVVFKQYYNIGLAAATERGLVVPVLRDANRKSLLDLAKEIGSLARKAGEGALSGEDMKGASFTISNQGGIGGGHFTPLLNPPEAAILGAGRASRKPVVRDGELGAATLLPLAFSYDHRLNDGADAATFMVALVKQIEQTSEDEVKP